VSFFGGVLPSVAGRGCVCSVSDPPVLVVQDVPEMRLSSSGAVAVRCGVGRYASGNWCICEATLGCMFVGFQGSELVRVSVYRHSLHVKAYMLECPLLVLIPSCCVSTGGKAGMSRTVRQIQRSMKNKNRRSVGR
jgi:hypothetical protein